MPCALTGPVEVGGLTVTAETLVPGGSQLPVDGGAEPFAALLARLVSCAPDPTAVPSLAPSPPWTGWDHPGARLWPDRDDRGRDLNAAPGLRGSTTLPAGPGPAQRLRRSRRIGHGDWESQNIRWSGGAPLAVHDWDSVIAQPEPAIVGLAAAVWPAAGAPGEAATVAQSAEFIAAYQRAADRQWSEQEIQNAWAAGLWVRLFNAKKDAANGGGPQLDRLADEVGERLALALGERVNAGTRPAPRLRGTGREQCLSSLRQVPVLVGVSAQSQICSWVPEPPKPVSSRHLFDCGFRAPRWIAG